VSATVKELLKSDSICESYVQMKKGPVFYDSQCRNVELTCSSSSSIMSLRKDRFDSVCVSEATSELDMSFNAKKSAIIRVGRRYKNKNSASAEVADRNVTWYVL